MTKGNTDMNRPELIIAKKNELQNGQMKKISISDEEDVLLVRIDDKFYARTAYCPHYGASLETGVLDGPKLMCPWHHASFDIPTGELTDPPALHGLTSYKIEVRGEDVVLFPAETTVKSSGRTDERKTHQKDEATFVIIGGGSAGNAAAHQLRASGFDGHLKIISADTQPPYDRPNLSKDFLKGDMDPGWLPLNDENFFQVQEIDLMLAKRVTGIDAQKKRIDLEDQTTLGYDKLLVASGSRPRKLNIPGHDLDNIFTLRTAADAAAILEQAEKAKRITVIGASFIGMEAAENLDNENREVHIIGRDPLPFAALFGKEMGELLKQKKENDGITFHLGQNVSEFRGNKKLETVILDNGQPIDSDLAVLGIGVEPVTDFMPHFNKAADESLLTDEYLQVENDIFAAGDIATFPYWRTEGMIRVEHWRTAEQLGIIAAENMLGLKKSVQIIPYFWTNLGGMSCRYVGYPGRWDESVVHGSMAQENFMIYYIAHNQVMAVLGIGRDKHMALIELLMRKGRIPSADKIKEGDWTAERLQALI